MLHPAQLPVERLLEDCRVVRSRRSGPGGQHRNKVETAVVIKHLPSGLQGEASERRSQAQNRRHAIQRLRVKLALAIRQPPEKLTSHLWQKRIAGERLAVNPLHGDFPALLAEALDVIDASEHQTPIAAERLGITASQLVKLLKLDRNALDRVNSERSARGLPQLR